MGASKYIAKTLQKEWQGKEENGYNYNSLMKAKELEYRKTELTVLKLERPTHLPNAKSVGYKAKQGIIVARVKVRRGHGTYERPKNKRRPKRQGQGKLTRRKSTQSMAEEKASKKFHNAEVLGSYKVAEDGRQHYFEVVLAERDAPTIKTDKELSFLTHGQKGRAERGKTYSGRNNVEENQKVHRKKKKKKNILYKNNRSK